MPDKNKLHSIDNHKDTISSRLDRLERIVLGENGDNHIEARLSYVERMLSKLYSDQNKNLKLNDMEDE